MAEYGAALMDSSGRQFARVDGGDSYHYWGQVTMTMNGQWQQLPLFNIPATVKICAFIHCAFSNDEWAARYGEIQVRHTGGNWCIRGYRSFAGTVQPSFASATVYVFVPAAYIPQEAYGLQCYDAAGRKVYDSARPLLQIAGVGSGGTLTSGSASFFNRTPAKCAAPYSNANSKQFLVVNGTAFWAVIKYYGTTTGVLNGFTGMISRLDQGGSQPQNQTFANIPLIDAGYYDNFPNLPSM